MMAELLKDFNKETLSFSSHVQLFHQTKAVHKNYAQICWFDTKCKLISSAQQLKHCT